MSTSSKGSWNNALLAVVAVSYAGVASAQQPGNLEPLPDLPAPPRMSSMPMPDEEPTVTIRQAPEGKIEEYRVGGKVVGVRVTPVVGAPYLLTDPDGNGTLVRTNEIGNGLRPALWTLFEF